MYKGRDIHGSTNICMSHCVPGCLVPLNPKCPQRVSSCAFFASPRLPPPRGPCRLDVRCFEDAVPSRICG